MLLNSFINGAKGFLKPNNLLSPVNLATQSQRSIVYRYVPKRSPFDKTSYVDYYIPPPVKYHKSRKPRLPEWDDPNVHWPPILPKPTKLEGKELIRSLESREKYIQDSLRPFKVPDVRSGDIIEFKYLFSVSESLGNILNGIVIGRSKRNSYNSSFKVLMRFGGEKVLMEFKEMSPLLVGMKIISKGSGGLRKKLFYLRDRELKRQQYMRPIIKGRMRPRNGEQNVKKKKHRLGIIIYDTKKDPILYTTEDLDELDAIDAQLELKKAAAEKQNAEQKQ